MKRPCTSGAIVAVLAGAHRSHKRGSDKVFKERMAALQSRGTDWKADDGA